MGRRSSLSPATPGFVVLGQVETDTLFVSTGGWGLGGPWSDEEVLHVGNGEMTAAGSADGMRDLNEEVKSVNQFG